MVTGVAEPKAGDTTELGGQSPPGKGGTPAGEKVSQYTLAELEAAVQAAKSQGGREKKALETENATLKAQLQNKDTDLAANTAEIDKLQVKFDNLAKDDPEKFDIAKELKLAREDRKQLRTDRQALEAEKVTHGEQVKLATDTLREISIWEIATEYEASDPVKLKDLCETFTATSEEQIRKVADTLWGKKAEAKSGVVKLYSGQSSGGSEDFTGLSPREKIQKGIDQLTKK